VLLIGLTGAKRSGKGSAAGYIIGWAFESGLTAVERGFSDVIKLSAYRCLADPNGTLADALEWEGWFKTKGEIRTNEYKHITGREFLQRYGTEAHRDIFGQNFWVDYLIPNDDPERLRANFANATIGIISDLRFDNEAERIHELGGVVWNIERNGIERDDHSSEAGVDPSLIDCTIKNDGSLGDLYKTVGHAVEDHKIDLRMSV
jgi:hypothetical protein